MPRLAFSDPPGSMLSAPQLRALLDEHGVVEAPQGQTQPLAWMGVLHCVVDPAPPPLDVWGWEARTPIGMRVGDQIIMMQPGELQDPFRLRVAREFGGLGRVAHFVYKKGTR